jgi:transcriptional regulator GlxA family with amidase domain
MVSREPARPATAKAALSVGARRFERLFSAETGMSPTRFNRQLRLRYGLWRLRSTTHSVTALSEAYAEMGCG